MKRLKIILKWVLPSAKFVYRMLAVSAEVFCRHTFGPRYAPFLLAGFLFCFVSMAFLRVIFPNKTSHIIDVYLFSYFILVLWHLFRMWFPRIPTHSYSSGYSWELWERLNITPAVVKIMIEPSIIEIVGWLIHRMNMLLSDWIAVCGLCLCVKEFLSFWRLRNRILDAVDARLEGERISAGVRHRTSPRAGGEQRARPAISVEQPQQPNSSIGQIYSRLDPALQQLIVRPTQNRPTNRPGGARIVVRPAGGG